jgi:predicted nucleotidyltransferase
MTIPDQVQAAAHEHPYPLLFATVSGAHLYGFASADSDWDLRGVHILPAQQVVGLLPLEETIELARNEDIELDLVTHDVRKFFTLLLRPNGYVLEQLLSPIIVNTSPGHEELKQLVPSMLTRFHAHHYIGFANNQWELFRKEPIPRVKPLLYTFRVLLTGIHLMQSHRIEANLAHLNEIYHLPFIPELMARKIEGVEKQTLAPEETEQFEREFLALRERLVDAAAQTSLPETTTARPALNDLLVRLRLAAMERPSATPPASSSARS